MLIKHLRICCVFVSLCVVFLAGCSEETDETLTNTEKPLDTNQPKEITGEDGAPMVLILDYFYMDKYEVTNAQYRRFVQATGYKRPIGYGLGDTNFEPWSDSRFNGDNQPVVCISWEDAKAYAEWAGERLPTPSEWGRAARGGPIEKEYFWGDDWPPPQGAGNFADETAKNTFQDWQNYFWGADHIDDYNDGYIYTAPVGRFTPNGYGLYDMEGNVGEWCDVGHYLGDPPYNNVTGGSWLSCNQDNFHIGTGGGGIGSDKVGLWDVGFRCVYRYTK